ncbi:speriolin-like protein [Cottoperca gobio]|uniref:Speriolin-like protein n=1 Tax=Cottoperca gobio TaxID=56716 RepID=A0A6J2R9P5_COTGO|nr:speriolin-like protein [Cottoperca gobio]
MDLLEQTLAALLSKNGQLGKENDLLKSMLSVVKENVDLRGRMQSFNNETLEELTGPDRLLGEIVYQLDRRILSHVFQGQRRLYGFTLPNIPGKIREIKSCPIICPFRKTILITFHYYDSIVSHVLLPLLQVSTHPLTGKVDEGYQLHLTQRHADLMERLNQLGYKTELHPPFTEFIVNNYGILKDRPGENSAQSMDYNNPDFLSTLIMTTAPRMLQKDLLLLLTCLCNMAEKDRKPLLLW